MDNLLWIGETTMVDKTFDANSLSIPSNSYPIYIHPANANII